MEIAPGPGRYAYARGEEVIARLSGADVYHVQGGGHLSEACVPGWTIGKIVSAQRGRAGTAYLLRFKHDGCDCLCWVSETSIDGIC